MKKHKEGWRDERTHSILCHLTQKGGDPQFWLPFRCSSPPLPPPPHKGKGKSREARTQTLALLSDSWCGLHPIPPLSYCEHGTSTSWRMRTAFQKVIALKFDSNIHCKWDSTGFVERFYYLGVSIEVCKSFGWEQQPFVILWITLHRW